MNKMLILLILLIPLISACSDNNDFTIGDDIEICSSDCKYQNETDFSFNDCDDSVSCHLTTSYPNGSLIFFKGSMTRENNFFKFNASNYNLSVNCYNSEIRCKGYKGWDDPIDFQFCIYAEDVSEGGRPRSGAEYFAEKAKEEAKDYADGMFEKAKKYWLLLFLGILFIGITLMGILNSRKKKKNFNNYKEWRKMEKK